MQENSRKHIDYTVTINNNQHLWALCLLREKISSRSDQDNGFPTKNQAKQLYFGTL